MALTLHSAPAPLCLWPLADGAALAAFPLAGSTFADCRDALWGDCAADVSLFENSWIGPDDLARVAAAGAAALADATGTILAWTGAQAPDGLPVLPASPSSFPVRFPWDLLKVNEQVVGVIAANRIDGDLSTAAHVEGTLVLGEGSRVLPGVFIEGKVVVGRGCKIGPNAYLRGNTSIGDGCHIGQAVEIKNSILGRKTNVGHLSYVGDSVLADGVNFGAGTITSNLRHDGASHRSLVDGRLIDTGRREFGTIVGAGVHTGIHTAIYPGRKLGPGISTRPGQVVATDIV